MSWLSSESHKLAQDIAIMLVFFKDEIKEFYIGFFRKEVVDFVEHRHHERRNEMTIPGLAQLIALIEELFKTHAPEIVAAASSPAVQAAATAAEGAAIQSVAQDPKVQAGIAAYQAIQNLKTVLQTPPPPPVA